MGPAARLGFWFSEIDKVALTIEIYHGGPHVPLNRGLRPNDHALTSRVLVGVQEA